MLNRERLLCTCFHIAINNFMFYVFRGGNLQGVGVHFFIRFLLFCLCFNGSFTFLLFECDVRVCEVEFTMYIAYSTSTLRIRDIYIHTGSLLPFYFYLTSFLAPH